MIVDVPGTRTGLSYYS